MSMDKIPVRPLSPGVREAVEKNGGWIEEHALRVGTLYIVHVHTTDDDDLSKFILDDGTMLALHSQGFCLERENTLELCTKEIYK